MMLESYENPSHLKANNECCENETSNCRLACSNTFKICISTEGRSDCDIGERTSDTEKEFGDDEIFDAEEIRFKNPLSFYFSQSTVSVFHL